MKISKQLIMGFLFLLLISVDGLGQPNNKTFEVLYFKANLACCKARACNALQNDVDSVITKYFAGKNIVLRVVRLADEANKGLIAKYNAKSQTVIIVKKEGNKESATDVSNILQEYARNYNKEKFEQSLKAKIDEITAM